MELHSLLSLHSVAAIKLNDLVILDSRDSLQSALKVLQASKLRAIPVFDESKDQYPGVVDIRTLLRELLKQSKIFKKSPSSSRVSNLSVTFSGEPKTSTPEEKRRIRCLAGPCGQITIYNNFRVILNNSSLLNALEIFGRGGSTVLGVAQPHPNFTIASNLASQSGVDLAGRATKQNLKLMTQEFFCTYIAELPEVQDALKRLRGTDIVQGGLLLTFPLHTPIQKCFVELATCYMPALALTGENGEFINMLSLADCFEYLNHPEDFQDCSAKDYLAHIKARPFSRKLLFLKNDSVRTVFERMVEHRVFNAWFVDKSQQPISFISATDILKSLYIAVRKKRDSKRMEDALITAQYEQASEGLLVVAKVFLVAYAFVKLKDFWRSLNIGNRNRPVFLSILYKLMELII